jgi:glutamate-1-semialdehyde 2,1-aminomutase
MPLLVFDDDPTFALAGRWTGLAADRGVYLHPHHNWFLSAAHSDADIDDALQRTEDAFAALA